MEIHREGTAAMLSPATVTMVAPAFIIARLTAVIAIPEERIAMVTGMGRPTMATPKGSPATVSHAARIAALVIPIPRIAMGTACHDARMPVREIHSVAETSGSLLIHNTE